MKLTTILILFLLGGFSAQSQPAIFLDDTMNIGRMRLNQPRRVVLGLQPDIGNKSDYRLVQANYNANIYPGLYNICYDYGQPNIVAVINNFYPFQYGNDYRGRFFETYYIHSSLDGRRNTIVLTGEVYQPLSELRWIYNYASRLTLDTMNAGETMTKELEFVNNGESPLRIDVTTTVSPSNGLIRLEYPTTAIPPHGTGKVKVSFIAASRGVVNFQVTVRPNNWQPRSVYNFSGYVRSSVITPPVVTTPPIRTVPTN